MSWLHDPQLTVFLRAGRLSLAPSATDSDSETPFAQLRRTGDSYEIKALPGQALWVNGLPIEAKQLAHGDVVEFGETGPLSRFRLFDANHKMTWTSDQIIGDCIAYMRTSRRPVGSRLLCAARDIFRRLVLETSIIFRTAVLVAIAVLIFVSYQQWRFSEQLELSIAQRAQELEGVSAALARARKEALRPDDLLALKNELGLRVTSNKERLEALEQRSRAGTEVIANAAAAVAFIQGAYGLRQIATGRMLRRAIDGDGNPITTPSGRPLVSFDGNGPVAEIEFTGTGFILDGDILVTNRHVALPWADDQRSKAMAVRGNKPELIKLVTYLPGQLKAIPLTLMGTSSDADLALLKLQQTSQTPKALKLSADPARAGEEVILMGYPTGLRSMLAQSGVPFIKKLQKDGEFDF